MYPLAKRLIDIILAAVLLVVVLPVYVCLATIIKLTSRGPVLFKQERTGRGGKPFTLLKFRSMAADNNVMDASSADKLTRVGRVMRKLSLDELPQLFNVLCGDMSFIGPRPWIPEYHKHMTPRQKRRLSVRPGITGLAQIKGRNGIGIHDKIKYDLRYVDHLNFREDLKVLVLTFLALWDKTAEDFGKSGIHQELAELKAHAKEYFQLVSSESIDSQQRRDAKVSIVVPVYNAAKFLRQTIKTVQQQTYANWELIFVDDCSADKSLKILYAAAEKDGRITVLECKENSGAARTRNAGIRHASGRYLAFLDADDLWQPEKLRRQVDFMTQRNCEFSFTGYEFADATGKPNGKRVRVPATITYRQALKNTTIWTSTVMLDLKQLSKDDVYMPDVRRGQDTATWWKILKRVPAAYGLDEVLSFYRRTVDSLSANKIIALKRTWNLYRNHEQLGVVPSGYHFTWYVINALRRRV